jgi:hypothetical protein
MGRQAGDFLVYILLPLACVVLPHGRGQALIRRIADEGWLLNARSKSALRSAQRYLVIADPEAWKRRWRRAELSEARDLWFALLGRGRALRRAVRVDGMPPARQGLVLIGMHWGPSVLALQLFREAGLQPRFVYRAVGIDILRAAPFRYVYLRLLVAYIRRSCGGCDIPVPGARSRLETALREPGTPIILLDAPVTRTGHSLQDEVLGLTAEFSREGPELLVSGGARCVFYALGMGENGVNALSCEHPIEPDSADELVAAYCRFLGEHLRRDSAQWRLWHAAEQLFRGRVDELEARSGKPPPGNATRDQSARAG